MRERLLAELQKCEGNIAACEAAIRAGAPAQYGTADKWWLWVVGYIDNCNERRLILEELNATTR